MLASDIRRQRINRMRGFRNGRWNLNEVFAKINGETQYLWWAVDHEGEILESYVTSKRGKKAALAFLRKTLRRHGQAERIMTDGHKSHPAAMGELENEDHREMGRWKNDRVETTLLPFQWEERLLQRFSRMKSLQKLASVHAKVHNHLNSQSHLVDRQTYKTARSAALAEWQKLMA